MSIVYYARQTSNPSAKIPPLLDHLAADRVNSVSLVFPLYTDSVTANSVHSGPDTPTNAALTYFITQARARGLAVMVRPIIDEGNLPSPEWRGTLRPSSVPAWFDNYRSLMLHYAQLAAGSGAQILNIGTELNTLEAYPDSWRQLISSVRTVFNGSITYSANWQGFKTSFWGALDFVSFDAYFPLDAASPTASDVAAAWQPALNEVRQALAPYGKPVVFTEIGVQSRAGAYRRPWVRDPSAPIDLAEQSAYYDGTCRATRGVVRGLYWWNVYLIAPTNPSQDGDYTPIGKPAESVLRNCLATSS